MTVVVEPAVAPTFLILSSLMQPLTIGVNLEADAVFRTAGTSAYRAFQREHEQEPLSPGAAFHFIVTARSWPADRRVVTTLRSWGIMVDEAFFLGGAPKDPVLAQFRPHIFSDDRRANVDHARVVGPSVHVPFGILNPPG